ncbi:MAG: acetylglutamate kinase, partial [Betaproteobacteria bacterium]
MSAPVVLKLGGELLEDRAQLESVVAALAAVAAAMPLVVVHGGGREIDAALRQAGLEKRQVEGLRITDPAALAVVVAVLAGAVNTRLTAALTTAGVRAVGLTGADGACGIADRAPAYRTADGRTIDLGEVGVPAAAAHMGLVTTLVDAGYVPVVASVGLGRDGRLLNVNADTFAGHLAARLPAARLIIAGTTPGVLDADGRTIRDAGAADIERLVGEGTATNGMVAKLGACTQALAGGVRDVLILDGRDGVALEEAASG